MQHRKYIHIITLGCSKNIVDSEHLMRQIELAGYKVSHNSNHITSGIVIINTCGFILDAREESIDTILEFVHAKMQGKIQNVYVIGCLSQIYKDQLRKEIPEVDQFFGVSDFKDVLKILGIDFSNELLNERVLTTPNHFAYLKIAEGCDRTCAFCSIPAIRGKHVSLTIDEVKMEAQKLAKKGVKELILIAQDLTYYGLDIYHKRTLATLLEELVTIEGIEWIRLHYAYPHNFPMDVIEVMQKNPRICKYLDIPFQHISNRMLTLMRRGNNKEQALRTIQQIRESVPEIALRTTLLVGHPGETEPDFNELLDFVQEIRFDRLGVFTYSHEEHSFAFNAYNDEIPQSVKLSRVDAIMQLQRQISSEKNHCKIGHRFKVIIDRVESDYWIGRTEFDSPEVDNEVLIPISNPLQIGQFYTVQITDANDYDLTGTIYQTDSC